jgi:hypothetical protein
MAASNGTMFLLGKSGRSYAVDLYLPDAVGGLVGFNPNGASASTSPTQYRVPEACVITDVSIVTGTTAVGAVLNVNNAALQGGALRYAIHLNTLNNRPSLRIPVAAGDFVGATQI